MLRMRKNIVAGELLVHAVDSKYIIDPGVRKHIETQVMEVKILGPKVNDLSIGDIVILPPTGGMMVSLYDDETEEELSYCLIEDEAILAVLPGEHAS